MKVTGTRSQVRFDLENGYTATANGELLVGGAFVVYKDTMKVWDPPHENEKISAYQIEMIINEVQSLTNEKTVKLFFE